MADLLIKGLEIPKGDLALWIFVHKDGTVEYLDNNKYEGYKTMWNAAVTVPPHGRLIDADALKKAEEWKHGIINQETVNAAPTIIPASKVEG